MISTACAAGENPRLDLPQSYAWHQACPGLVHVPVERQPQACSCPHHGMMPQAPRRKATLRAKARLVVAVAVVLLLAWAYLR